MNQYWCPNVEHVTAEETWCCETCGNHGCHLCEEGNFYDENGGRLCLGCRESSAPRPQASGSTPASPQGASGTTSNDPAAPKE